MLPQHSDIEIAWYASIQQDTAGAEWLEDRHYTVLHPGIQ